MISYKKSVADIYLGWQYAVTPEAVLLAFNSMCLLGGGQAFESTASRY
jgi:hypothetical protein